jgi:hypothetical protein
MSRAGRSSHARVALMAALLAPACQAPAEPPPRPPVTALRPAGTWRGTGSQTVGFVSESGRFRVTWETRGHAGVGTFRLTAHSAVSGRPIQLVADHRGEGGGTATIEDDPRPYNLMVESSGVEWSIVVEDIVAAPPPRPAGR